MKSLAIAVLGFGLVLSGCSKSATDTTAGQSATVHLKDGTTFSGTVSKSDASEISVQSSNGESRTYPMTQVDSVQYFTPSATPTDATATDSAAKPSPAPSASKMTSTTTTTTTTAPPPPPPPVVERVIPAGARIRVRNNSMISAQTASSGQGYSAVIAADVMDEDGSVAIPKGSNAMLVVRAAHDQGKMQGTSELVLDMDSVEVGGRQYKLETGNIVRTGKQGVGTNKRTGKFAGGGAAVGAIMGGIFGGGKGAAIGAAAGAGAGVAAQSATRGKAVNVPSETLLTFTLEQPVAMR